MAALAVTVASVAKSSSASLTTATAAATITQGQPLYLNASGNALPANAAPADALTSTVVGISLNAALSGQPVSYCALDSSFSHGFSVSDVAAGQVVYLDDTAGNMTVTYADLDAADYVAVIGVINATETTMTLRPITKVIKA